MQNISKMHSNIIVIPDHLIEISEKFQNLNRYDSLTSAERRSENDALVNHVYPSRLLYVEIVFSDLSSRTCAQIHCEINPRE